MSISALRAVGLTDTVHPSRRADVAEERFRIEPDVFVENYVDSFGNHCGRVCVRGSSIRFRNEALIRDSGNPDPYVPEAQQYDVCDIPVDTLLFLLPSRYCEVDSELLDFAWKTFAGTPPGWARVQAVCDFVHGHMRFDYQQARPNRIALEAFREPGVHVSASYPPGIHNKDMNLIAEKDAAYSSLRERAWLRLNDHRNGVANLRLRIAFACYIQDGTWAFDVYSFASQAGGNNHRRVIQFVALESYGNGI